MSDFATALLVGAPPPVLAGGATGTGFAAFATGGAGRGAGAFFATGFFLILGALGTGAAFAIFLGGSAFLACTGSAFLGGSGLFLSAAGGSNDLGIRKAFLSVTLATFLTSGLWWGQMSSKIIRVAKPALVRWTMRLNHCLSR